MTRREAWITALAVFAVAIAVRVVAASIISFPKPEDTAYYVGVARNLVEGRGLVSDALWSYGTPPLVFPRPAFEVWLPLPSLLAAIPMALAGGPARSRSRRRCARPRSCRSSPARSCASSPGASPRTSPWSAACPLGRARTLAVGAGLDGGGLPAPAAPLVAARLDDAVRRPRARRGAADDARPARPAGARALDAALIGIGLLIGLAALTRNEAVWLALAWAWLACGCATRPRPAGCA